MLISGGAVVQWLLIELQIQRSAVWGLVLAFVLFPYTDAGTDKPPIQGGGGDSNVLSCFMPQKPGLAPAVWTTLWFVCDYKNVT